MLSERKYLIALSTYVPFGPARIGLLHKYFKSYKAAWNAPTSVLLSIGVSQKLVAGFDKHRSVFDIDRYLKLVKDKKIQIITKDDELYPKNLKDLANAPVVLYVFGKLLPQDKVAIAVVGTRRMTSYGREVTDRIVSQLAEFGVTIVSGLALGIDAQAHISALRVNGRCIAVLASGLDTITPVSNRKIAVEIVRRKLGAIITEYPLGYPPAKENFPHRNRIISGLSKAVLVPEARIASGTIHTVNHAVEQGREIFAVPGSILALSSELPLHLIKNGSKIATSAMDIVAELDLQMSVDVQQVEKIMPSDEVEKIIIEILETEPLQFDELARKMKMKPSKLSAKLSMMELKGMVRNIDGEYRVK